MKQLRDSDILKGGSSFWNDFDGEEYKKEYLQSVENNFEFWKNKANTFLSWSKKFTKVYEGKFGSDLWFEDGELNACYNCIDRWVEVCPDKIAFIFDDNEGGTKTYTYKECLGEILEICHVIKDVKQGECITLYLSMSPKAVFSALACARLGIVHNFVFGGFSAESLELRIKDSNSKLIITEEYALRGTKKINFLKIVENATKEIDIKVFIFDKLDENDKLELNNSYCNLDNTSSLHDENIYKKLTGNWIRWSETNHSREYIECKPVNSEHPLFYLYTSGSTGKPKGLVHTTGGYLLYIAYSLKVAFGVKSNDIFCCTADIGWITGHSYAVYGPLMLGITSVILQGLPVYPTPYRLFDIVNKYKVTQLYTAPTVIRILKSYFEMTENKLDLSKHDLSSLRFLGCVGEPLNKQAYMWYSETFGNIPVIDTYFQTETGGIIIAPLSGIIKNKPECAALPVPGIIPAIINDFEESNFCKSDELGKIYILKPWPGIARGILNDRSRFVNTYFTTGLYFTGDEGKKDNKALIHIRGRADDVINISGHRISTSEVESAALANTNVNEAAIVAVEHPIKGQSMLLFVVLSKDISDYGNNIKESIVNAIGSFAKPDKVIKCVGIPKTATGKIMRRVLRDLALCNKIGDLSTCINPEVVEAISNELKCMSI